MQPNTSGTHDLRASIETLEDHQAYQQHQQQQQPQPVAPAYDHYYAQQQRPVYAAPSLMSVRSCFVVPTVATSSSNNNGHHHQPYQSQLPYHYAQSQPQLSHSFSQPFISRISNSADHLVTSSLSQLHNNTAEFDHLHQQYATAAAIAASAGGLENATLPFHEHVKNSAAHKFQQKNSSVSTATVDSSSDVNVIGTAVRIQVRKY